MSRVVVFDEFGGPEVLKIDKEPVIEPATGEVRIRIEAFAVNPLDVMMRSGASPAPVPLPHARLGIEGSGVVDAVGPEVAGLEIGDPVIITAIPDSSVRGSLRRAHDGPGRLGHSASGRPRRDPGGRDLGRILHGVRGVDGSSHHATR